ncbi:MAG: hypothetical protein LQ351_005531 [Letrouitia transgressa]|nr:MAG: hypothetical protein LQ351_005531 [Letrouitia transgressa]
MIFPKLTTLLVCALSTISYAAVVKPPNALALLESQDDLTFITTLIKRDPVLTRLYKTAKDITVAAPTDQSFKDLLNTSSIDLDGPLFPKDLVRAVEQELVLEGRYPLSSFKKKAKLALQNGQKTLHFGGTRISNVTQGDIAFKGGLLHKINLPVLTPVTISATAPGSRFPGFGIDNEALQTAASLGLLKELDKTRDVTIFTIANSAFDSKITVPSLKSVLQSLKYYVITPGVYYGNGFTGQSVKTLSGDNVTLAGFGKGDLTVNGVKVVLSDTFTVNGVIHVLEGAANPFVVSRKLFPVELALLSATYALIVFLVDEFVTLMGKSQGLSSRGTKNEAGMLAATAFAGIVLMPQCALSGVV